MKTEGLGRRTTTIFLQQLLGGIREKAGAKCVATPSYDFSDKIMFLIKQLASLNNPECRH